MHFILCERRVEYLYWIFLHFPAEVRFKKNTSWILSYGYNPWNFQKNCSGIRPLKKIKTIIFAIFLRLQESRLGKISFASIRMKVGTILHNYQKVHNFLLQCWLKIISLKNRLIIKKWHGCTFRTLKKFFGYDKIIWTKQSQ